jgi:xylitol oxidase
MITGTHGSGHKYKSHSASVLDFEMVFPDGNLKTLIKDKTPHFYSYLHSFGGLGVITKMTMYLVPKFMVNKAIYSDL